MVIFFWDRNKTKHLYILMNNLLLYRVIIKYDITSILVLPPPDLIIKNQL